MSDCCGACGWGSAPGLVSMRVVPLVCPLPAGEVQAMGRRSFECPRWIASFSAARLGDVGVSVVLLARVTVVHLGGHTVSVGSAALRCAVAPAVAWVLRMFPAPGKVACTGVSFGVGFSFHEAGMDVGLQCDGRWCGQFGWDSGDGIAP